MNAKKENREDTSRTRRTSEIHDDMVQKISKENKCF